jgi:uncharacterized protein
MNPLDYIGFLLRIGRDDYTVPSMYRRIEDIGAGDLRAQGIENILMDVDLSLTNFHGKSLDGSVEEKLLEFQRFGMDVYIVSNCKPEREAELRQMFSRYAGVRVIGRAHKPGTDRFLDEYGPGFGGEKTVMIGDRLYTDGEFAARLGAGFIYLSPRSDDAPWYIRLFDKIERNYLEKRLTPISH